MASAAPPYHVVFDIGRNGVFHPIFLLFVGLAVLFVALHSKESYFNGSVPAWIAHTALKGGVLLMVVLLVHAWRGRARLIDNLQNGRCKVVEGMISRFDPMPLGGHKAESFEVNGVRFKYSADIYSPGFHHPHSRGGPLLMNGMQVRVTYRGNDIARFEIGE